MIVAAIGVMLSAFGIGCLTTWLLLLSSRKKFRLLDYPNHRSLHHVPVPRVGGLAIWAGLAAGVAIVLVMFGFRYELVWIITAVSIVGFVSLADDWFDVPILLRLVVHIAGGGLLLLGGLSLESIKLPGLEIHAPVAINAILGVSLIVWMINLYNFMDGMDGFAGGMAIFGFGTLGVLAYMAGDEYFALLCVAVTTAVAGFLVFNFPPARIFMGDGGASVLGLLAAALSLWGDSKGLFPFWVAVLIFSPFVVDATVTLVRRSIRGEPVWRAHRSHYYQQLVQLGWGHRKTVIAEYALMGLCAISAVVCTRVSVLAQWAIIIFWIFAYIGIMITVDQLMKQAVGGKQNNEIS